jgi:hypothetical protein
MFSVLVCRATVIGPSDSGKSVTVCRALPHVRRAHPGSPWRVENPTFRTIIKQSHVVSYSTGEQLPSSCPARRISGVPGRAKDGLGPILPDRVQPSADLYTVDQRSCCNQRMFLLARLQ